MALNIIHKNEPCEMLILWVGEKTSKKGFNYTSLFFSRSKQKLNVFIPGWGHNFKKGQKVKLHVSDLSIGSFKHEDGTWENGIVRVAADKWEIVAEPEEK